MLIRGKFLRFGEDLYSIYVLSVGLCWKTTFMAHLENQKWKISIFRSFNFFKQIFVCSVK